MIIFLQISYCLMIFEDEYVTNPEQFSHNFQKVECLLNQKHRLFRIFYEAKKFNQTNYSRERNHQVRINLHNKLDIWIKTKFILLILQCRSSCILCWPSSFDYSPILDSNQQNQKQWSIKQEKEKKAATETQNWFVQMQMIFSLTVFSRP